MDFSKFKQKIYKAIKVLLFFSVGLLIFESSQTVLAKKWNRPVFPESVSASLNTFYNQQEGVDQVLFFGTSHSEFGVSPMEIYEDSGIVSYNLSTSSQPIEVTYHLLKSALETQAPNVVMLDVSSLFFDDTINTAAWRYVLDGMPFCETKIEMAMEFAKYVNDTNQFDLSCEKDFINALVPMFQYHTRWDELTERDFHDVWMNHSYVNAGYFMSTSRAGSVSVDEMNLTATTLSEQDKYYKIICDEDECQYYDGNDSLYPVEITNRKKKYLNLIENLCKENEATLVLAKYPSIANPIYYGSAWTLERSEVMKEFAEEEGLQFLDFVYDIDCGFDYTSDFQDGGAHCNYYGAKKISLWLSNYLHIFFGLQSIENETFEENREIYDKLTEIAEIQISRDSNEILNYITENKNKYIICISAKDDMVSGLSDEEIWALNSLGLKTDFRNTMSYSDSYLAIIDQGDVEIERASNREISYETKIKDCGDDEIKISLVSSGYLSSPDSQIVINNEDYSLDNRGLNIVLIDVETQQVVISKSIDTFMPIEEQTVSSGNDLTMLLNYWEELIK